MIEELGTKLFSQVSIILYRLFFSFSIQFIFYFFYFYFYFLPYNIVLVLPYINMNPPWMYRCSQSWTLLPPRTIPLGHPSAPAPSILYRASNLDWQFVSYMILYMFQCHSLKSSHPLHLLFIKKNTFESVIRRWMKLELNIQSEVSQKEKHQHSILTHIYGI